MISYYQTFFFLKNIFSSSKAVDFQEIEIEKFVSSRKNEVKFVRKMCRKASNSCSFKLYLLKNLIM